MNSVFEICNLKIIHLPFFFLFFFFDFEIRGELSKWETGNFTIIPVSTSTD